MNATARFAIFATCAAIVLAGCNVAHGAGAFAPPMAAAMRSLASPIALDAPIALAEDKHGNLYVGNAGTGANEVLIYDARNKQLTSETITDRVKAPAGLAFDKKGNLYVVDALTHEVTVYSPSRQLIAARTIHTDKRNSLTPSGVQIDSRGNVWVASRDPSDFSVGEVQVFNKRGKLIHTATQHLEYPVGIVFVGSNAWVCDSTTPAGNSFTVLDASANFVRTVATPNFTPTYAALKGSALYVTDGVTSRIEALDTSGHLLRTITKGLDAPYGIAFNKAGDFYVANVVSNTISEYSGRGQLIHKIK